MAGREMSNRHMFATVTTRLLYNDSENDYPPIRKALTIYQETYPSTSVVARCLLRFLISAHMYISWLTL